MIYYLRHRIFGNVVVESAVKGEAVQNLNGFIRLTPEITCPDDVTPEVIAALKEEADAWVKNNPQESSDCMVIDAVSIVRPSLVIEDTAVWTAMEITADLDPFNITGSYKAIRVEYGNERWDFEDIMLALAPGQDILPLAQAGRLYRYVVIFNKANYNLINKAIVSDRKAITNS